jgi:hypothetical protein
MPEHAPAPVRYRDDVEVRQPNEDRIADEIIDAMRGIAETGLDHYRHAVRPATPRATACSRASSGSWAACPSRWRRACSRRRGPSLS